MHVIITLIVGLVVGALAKLAMPGKDPGGFIITMLLGVAGSFVAASSATRSAGTPSARGRASSHPFSER